MRQIKNFIHRLFFYKYVTQLEHELIIKRMNKIEWELAILKERREDD